MENGDMKRPLEIVFGPLVPTLLFLPPMTMALIALASTAAEGRAGSGLFMVMIVLAFGAVGTIALWVAVLRERRFFAESRWWRWATILGLALGLVAVAIGLPGFLRGCAVGWECTVPGVLLVGPVVLGTLHVIRLISLERAHRSP